MRLLKIATYLILPCVSFVLIISLTTRDPHQELAEPTTLSDNQKAVLAGVKINPKPSFDIAGNATSTDSSDRIQELRKRFPDNQLIPRPMSATEAEGHRERRLKEREVRLRFVAGRGSADEIDSYFDHQRSLVEDRIELLEYVIAEGKASTNEMERYQNMLTYSYKQIIRSEIRREQAHKTRIRYASL